MILKVDNDKLKEFTNNMNNDSSDFDKEINKLINLVNSLEEVWQGIDSENYRKNVLNYLEKMKAIPTTLSTLSKVTDRLNEGYQEKDREFTNRLEGVKNKYAK